MIMSIEDAKAHFKSRDRHSKWLSVLNDLKSFGDKNDWYMVCVNKGTSDEQRTRFMTYNEAIKFVEKMCDV